MACTEAQLKANQENAKKSTGPRTEEGKLRSRANAVQHGLSGEGVALPTDLEREASAREVAFARELKPATELERELVRKLALASVRSLAGFHLEMTLTAVNRKRDLECFIIDRLESAERLGARLADDPALVMIELRRTASGCDWLIERWENLARGLEDEICSWTAADLERAFDLLGVRPAERHLDAWAIDYRKLWERASDDEDPADAAEALQELAARVAEEIDALKAVSAERFELDKLDYAILEQDVRFDVSSEVRQVRRLTAAADTMFQRCFQQLRQREAAPKSSSGTSASAYASPPIAGPPPRPVREAPPLPPAPSSRPETAPKTNPISPPVSPALDPGPYAGRVAYVPFSVGGLGLETAGRVGLAR